MRAPEVQCTYKGYLSDHQPAIDIVQEHELQPRAFWTNYVSQRKPVLIQGHLSDAGWKATAKWTNEYLAAAAGNAPIQVEQRQGPADSYGKGSKVSTTFGKFLRRMARGDDTLYLTTQQVPVASDGHPALYTHPLMELSQDFEPQPSLAGHLVPQQMNLWMGRAKSGASSGLHHDFHDNLYILIRGRKRFRLWDPSKAALMYTNGKLRRVHPNGLIVYEGQGEVLDDGSDAKDVARWQARSAAEEEVAKAELAVSLGCKGAKKTLAKAEAKLERLLDAELDDALMDGFDDIDDDYVDTSDSDMPHQPTQLKHNGDQQEPPSFSKVDLSLPDSKIKATWPHFPGTAAALECTLEAGQMLYLPAGWFHEVTSFGDDEASGGGHMAFNYWFHPPDNLDSSYSGFSKPYTSSFFPSLWASRTGGSQHTPGTGAAKAGDAMLLDHSTNGCVHIHDHEHGSATAATADGGGGSSGGKQACKRRKSANSAPGADSTSSSAAAAAPEAAGSSHSHGPGHESAGKQQQTKQKQVAASNDYAAHVHHDAEHGGGAPGAAGHATTDMAEDLEHANLSHEIMKVLGVTNITEFLQKIAGSGLLAPAQKPRKPRGPRPYIPPPGRRHHPYVYLPREK